MCAGRHYFIERSPRPPHLGPLQLLPLHGGVLVQGAPLLLQAPLGRLRLGLLRRHPPALLTPQQQQQQQVTMETDSIYSPPLV